MDESIRNRNRIRDDQGRKQCSVCLEWKSADMFAMNRSRVDGLSYNCKDCQRAYMLLSRYGITQTEYNDMLVEQNYKCRICLRHVDAINHTLAVDHSHETGAVRGLLCQDCNGKLGWYEMYSEQIKDYL